MENTENKKTKNEPEESEAEEAIDEAAEELGLNLPKGDKSVPHSLKIIAFITLVGGLSILGGTLVDFVNPVDTNFWSHSFRIILGLTAIAIAYGLIEGKRWSIWLYGFITLLGLLINPMLAIFPLILLAYLYTQRHRLMPSKLDYYIDEITMKIKSFIRHILDKK